MIILLPISSTLCTLFYLLDLAVAFFWLLYLDFPCICIVCLILCRAVMLSFSWLVSYYIIPPCISCSCLSFFTHTVLFKCCKGDTQYNILLSNINGTGIMSSECFFPLHSRCPLASVLWHTGHSNTGWQMPVSVIGLSEKKPQCFWYKGEVFY